MTAICVQLRYSLYKYYSWLAKNFFFPSFSLSVSLSFACARARSLALHLSSGTICINPYNFSARFIRFVRTMWACLMPMPTFFGYFFYSSWKDCLEWIDFLVFFFSHIDGSKVIHTLKCQQLYFKYWFEFSLCITHPFEWPSQRTSDLRPWMTDRQESIQWISSLESAKSLFLFPFE